MAMKKGFLLIIAAAMLLVPVASYSCPSTTDTAEGHGGPMHGSMTDTPSDKVAGQPMSEMKGMKSDKAVDKPMTATQQGKIMQSK